MSFLIAETLQILLTRSGWSTHELARKTGVKQPIIHRLLSGENSNPKLATIEPIARCFNISISQLLGEEAFTKQNHEFSPINCEDWVSVPLIKNDQIENYSFLEKSKKCVMIDYQLSNKAFAIQVNNKNMEPAIPENAIVVIEPLLQPQSKDFVYVKSKKTFLVKCYITKGKNRFLLPNINNADTIEEFSSSNDIIIGTIIRVMYGRKATIKNTF